VSLADHLIEKADLQAESQIGLVRMLAAIALGFAALYFVSRAGAELSDADRRGLTLGLLAIGLYFVLGAVSVLIVWIGAYRQWMAWLFALVEAALIAMAILFQTLAAGESSLAALAAPAGFLIAPVLVLQILRYRLGLQIFASLTLIGATIFVVLSRPGGRDGADSQSVLFVQENFSGIANTARIFLLCLVAVIVGLSVARGRRLLKRIEEETEERINRTRFMPDELAAQMGEEELAGLRDGRLADLVIMNVDIRGFAAMTEKMSPEEVCRLLGEFRTRVGDAVAGWKGIVDRFAGDGAQIVFGLDGPVDTAARSAIDAALNLQSAISAWNSERDDDLPAIRITIALHCGELLAGMIGGIRRPEFSVIGAPVEETSRIALAAKQENLPLVASERILQQAGIQTGGADWLALEAQIQSGKEQPIRLFGLNFHT